MKKNDAMHKKSIHMDIFKKTIYYLAYKRKDKFAILILILFCIIVKNIFLGTLSNIFKKAENENIEVNLFVIKRLLMNTIICAIDFIYNALFENIIGPYGCQVSEMVLKKILYSNEYFMYNESASNMDYYIIEGSKQMAKLNKVLILGIFSKLIHLIVDTYYILNLDSNIRVQVLLMIVAGVTIANIMKLKAIKRLVENLQLDTYFTYKREKICSEAMESIQILKAYNEEKMMIEKYKRVSKLWEYSRIKYKYTAMIYNYIDEMLVLSLQCALGILYTKNTKNYNVSYLDFLLNKISNILKSTKNIVSLIKNISESMSLTYNVIRYLDMAIDDTKNQTQIDMFNDKLEIKKLGYSIKGRIIFKDLNMVLNKGDKVALFGRNGSGKSSIFRVLLNFDDYEGDIILDGINIRKISLKDYRALITYVPQDTRLFDDTIYSNLTFGNDCSYSDVIAQCKRLDIHDRIIDLKDGYNTIVGETGKNINGGLRQKIFYARALCRDTPIYLFDEPTNNLDEKGSKFLLDYLEDPAFRDKTIFIICHDMELVKQFPKRYIFEENTFKLYGTVN